MITSENLTGTNFQFLSCQTNLTVHPTMATHVTFEKTFLRCLLKILLEKVILTVSFKSDPDGEKGNSEKKLAAHNARLSAANAALREENFKKVLIKEK